jgi:hypothetical protein
VKARLVLVSALLLAGCVTNTPGSGKVVAQDRFEQLVVPGRTTKAELLAAFGETRTVVFDSGYEVWLYESPGGAPSAAGGRHTELVLLLGPDGVVRKMRRRPPYTTDPQR